MVYLVIWCGKMVYLVEVWQNGVFGWCIGKMVYLVGVCQMVYLVYGKIWQLVLAKWCIWWSVAKWCIWLVYWQNGVFGWSMAKWCIWLSVAKWCIWLECGKMVYLVGVWQNGVWCIDKMVYLVGVCQNGVFGYGSVWQNGVFGWCIAKWCIWLECVKMVYLVAVWQNGVFGMAKW